jgi:hypothetical protein
MAEISLTDGLGRITFDSSTIEGLEISYAGPAMIYIKSNQTAFASIGLEYIGIEELYAGNDLKGKGLRHFLRLVRNLDASKGKSKGTSDWTYTGMDAKGRFAKGANWITGQMEWHYALMNKDGSEAICAFCRIDDDHVCSAVSILREGDETKISKMVNLIKSIQARKDQ